MATEESKPKTPTKVAERPIVSLAGLQEEFGDKEGEAKYFAIARLEGEFKHPVTGEKVTGLYFFDPGREHGYRPDLTIATLPPPVRTKVAEIINTAQVKE
jgi:hypothetical protein